MKRLEVVRGWSKRKSRRRGTGSEVGSMVLFGDAIAVGLVLCREHEINSSMVELTNRSLLLASKH